MRVLLLTALALLTPTALAFDPCDGWRSALVPVGDVDGDGLADLAFAHRPQPREFGSTPEHAAKRIAHVPAVWVVSSATGEVLRSFRGTPGFGTELAAVGDLDEDGVAELLVGFGRGGSSEGVQLLSPGTGTRLATFAPPMRTRHFGRGLAGGVQLVGGPKPDFVISCEEGALVVDGDTLAPVLELRPHVDGVARYAIDAWAWPARDLEALDLEDMPKLPQAKQGNAMFDRRYTSDVHVVPDLDGDGRGEIVLTALPTAETKHVQPRDYEFGRPVNDHTAFVVWSSRDAATPLPTEAWSVVGGRQGAVDLVTAAVDRRMRAWRFDFGSDTITATEIWGRSFDGGLALAEGTSLAWSGDVDGDGMPDLALGANESCGDCDRGFVELASGRTGETLAKREVVEGELDRGSLLGGLDVTVLDDMTGDGIPELVVHETVQRRLELRDGKTLATLWSRDSDALEVRPEDKVLEDADQ